MMAFQDEASAAARFAPFAPFVGNREMKAAARRFVRASRFDGGGEESLWL